MLVTQPDIMHFHLESCSKRYQNIMRERVHGDRMENQLRIQPNTAHGIPNPHSLCSIEHTHTNTHTHTHTHACAHTHTHTLQYFMSQFLEFLFTRVPFVVKPCGRADFKEYYLWIFGLLMGHRRQERIFQRKTKCILLSQQNDGIESSLDLEPGNLKSVLVLHLFAV